MEDILFFTYIRFKKNKPNPIYSLTQTLKAVQCLVYQAQTER